MSEENERATSTYLDCNATTPIEPRVAQLVGYYLAEEFGNAGSRTHSYGTRAKAAVANAREQVAALANAKSDEVYFTSGATEANNIAILGLANHGRQTGKTHIISTAIEHKAVLEPLQRLEKQGFSVDLISPDQSGRISSSDILAKLRDDTLLVSLMHSNNETGVIQPLPELCEALESHDAYLHTDAAQTFGKEINTLKHKRIDLISASAHKLFAPKGVGALIARRRRFKKPPLEALMVGGGQERGLRPGTQAVHLIVGFGLAAEIAGKEHAKRTETTMLFRDELLQGLAPLEPTFIGDQAHTQPHIISLAIPKIDAEAALVGLKDLISISNGSACTSAEYKPSHVLQAMSLPPHLISGALRLSWCHMTPPIDWTKVVARLRDFQN